MALYAKMHFDKTAQQIVLHVLQVYVFGNKQMHNV